MQPPLDHIWTSSGIEKVTCDFTKESQRIWTGKGNARPIHASVAVARHGRTRALRAAVARASPRVLAPRGKYEEMLFFLRRKKNYII
jgi:hypothetical protein